MYRLKQYHLFISHAWDYHSDYDKIKQWLDDAFGLIWSDYSVPIDKRLDVNSTRELKARLENKIARCSCFIIPAGMYGSYSDWIEFEVKAAVAHRKPIVGVRPWGQQRVPRVVTENATCMVGWNSNSVIDAVRRYSI